MIRASIGTCVSYATTVLLQVLFARRFGAGPAAAAFVIVMGLMASASGLLVSTAQSIAVPRMLTPDGALAVGTVRFVALLSGGAAVLSAGLAAAAGPLAELVHRVDGLETRLTTDLIEMTAVVLLLQVVAGQAALVGLALGRRLLPALAPAFPTLAAAAALAVHRDADVREVYAWFAVGSLVQLAVVLTALAGSRVVPHSTPPVFGVTLLVLGSYVLLATIVPAERVLAAMHSAGDAAVYDYAVKSLRAVQQIILSGLVLASLGDWSMLAVRGRREELASSMVARLALAGTLLAVAVSIATVAGHDLVRLVFERGSFTAHDSDRVTSILLLALPGFWAEGIGLVVVSALAGTRRNAALALVGIGDFGLRMGLLVALAPGWGAEGAAWAYTVSNVASTSAFVVLAARNALWSRDWYPRIRPAVLVAGGTLLSAVAVAVLASGWPGYVGTAVVLTVFAGLTAVLRPSPLIVLRRPVVTRSATRR